MYLACPDLAAALASGSTVVTPNRLLSSVVAEQQITTKLQSGLEAWRPSPVFSLAGWLADLWQQARYARRDVRSLLSPSQEQAVWHELIEEEHPALFDYAGAVGLAISATRLLAEWHLPSEGESWSSASDTRHFQHLLRQFRQRADREGWITRADLWRLVPDWIGQPWCEAKRITFAGFQTTTPALDAILARLGSAARLAPVRLPPVKKDAPLFACSDLPQELDRVVRWARHQHEKYPGDSIGIVLPNLSVHQGLLHHTLQQVFYPGRGLASLSDHSVYHISAHQPLLHHPLVASALLILELAHPRLSVADAGAILRSPFLSAARAERNQRALADSQLRRNRDLDVSLADLEKASSHCPALSPVWAAVRRLLQQHSSHRELSDWSEFIAHLLQAAGWPGDDELTAREQQVVEDWKSALTDLAALGWVSSKLTLPAVLAHLRSILASRTIAIGDLSSPIQVLDATSAFGLRFDRAALAGLSADNWPPAVRPSPFLPIPLQRSMLASAVAARAALIEALFAAAPAVVATYSGDLAPAAKLHTKSTKADLARWSGLLPSQAPPAFPSAECIDDSEAPAFQISTSAVAGGVSILKAQSQCPFQAYAKYRLAARRPEDACFGFDARERGSFLHRALEHIWRHLQTRDQLRQTSLDGRRLLIRQAVDAAVGQQSSSPFHHLAGQAERERLEEVILEWLSVEEGREQPFTVQHIEKDHSLQIAGLPINLRIDRVDRLPNGHAVLIDYKSGEPKLKGLEGERPAEPQLLVYAAAMNEPVEGLFFAQLKPRNLKAVGWSRTTQFPAKGRGRKTTHQDWDGFLRHSNEAVQNIAAEFVSGWADVDPQPGACTFCNLKPLCRVNEQNGISEDSGDAD